MKTLFLSLLILARGLGAGAVPPQPTGLSSTASCQAWAPSESQSAAARGLSPAAGALSGTAAADLTPFLDRPWRSFLYGIFGLDKCFAKSGEPAELLFQSGGAYSLTIGSPDDGAAFALHRGNFGRSGAAWQMGEPGGAFTVRPYASMSAAEVQAALDRIWGAEQCGLGGDGSANWYFAKVDGKATKLKAVHNRAEADEQLKAQLARWNPLYFSSQLYAGFLLPAERVGVLK
ncbi:MAG TPA: hypothetical protein VNZ54_03615 [bacterium]|nr:hypothetical protein [bacterium]